MVLGQVKSVVGRVFNTPTTLLAPEFLSWPETKSKRPIASCRRMVKMNRRDLVLYALAFVIGGFVPKAICHNALASDADTL
jgi:hypothetical protein